MSIEPVKLFTYSEALVNIGIGSWTKPEGVTSITVECWGGGGGGGSVGTPTTFRGGGGGAGGQYSRKTLFYSSPSQNIQYDIGRGGASNTVGISGSTTSWNNTDVVAIGGAGGSAEFSQQLGGQGSTVGGVGDVVYAGGNGASGFYIPPGIQAEQLSAGGGGSGAGSTGPGNSASIANQSVGSLGGNLKSEYGGAGGNGNPEILALTNYIGLDGSNYGGGGSGGAVYSAGTGFGGDGAQGLIRVSYSGPEITIIGQVFRLANISALVSSSLSYTALDGTISSTSSSISGSIEYILVRSGSQPDGYLGTPLFTLAVTNLLVTSSLQQSFSFTEELITTPGSGNWTKPLGVTQVIVECWGGGGAGGGCTINDNGGAGGGGGSYSRKLVLYSSASTSIPYFIANSTTATTGNGATGGDTTWNINVVVAKGGTGGLANDYDGINIGSGFGVAQSGSLGDIVYLGKSGTGPGPGRGGFIAGSGGTGVGSVGYDGNDQFSNVELGGVGGSSLAIADGNSNGNPGGIGGGAGGGGLKASGANRTGGNGGPGLIRLIYR